MRSSGGGRTGDKNKNVWGGGAFARKIKCGGLGSGEKNMTGGGGSKNMARGGGLVKKKIKRGPRKK